jgi:two-component system sensor histidine kinase BarA
MNESLFTGLGLKSRILLLTVVPMLVITTVLTAFLIISRQDDAREELLSHADTSIQHLSRMSEIAVFTGDLNRLGDYAKAFLEDANVKGVAFYDQSGALLISAGKGLTEQGVVPAQSSFRENKGIHWLFQSPVFESEIQVDDVFRYESAQEESSSAILGWVQLLIDEKNLRDRQHEILITGLSIGGAGFILVVFLALRFARSITGPLSDLTEAVSQLEMGHLDTRLSIQAKGEIGVLVSRINRLANQVQQSREGLQGKVDHATQQLTAALQELKQKNSALQDTSAKLITANEAKDAFLARMSHELRTPINSVMGYCRLLSKTDLHGDQREYVQIINEASSLLLETSDDILDFSKLQSDAIQLERAPFHLESLLDAIFATHAYAIHIKRLELILFINSDVPVNLIGDAFRLRQVINNLVGNAIKFTGAGCVALEVSLVEENSSQALLEFSVKDTGIGIEKDVQEKIFEAFQQADVSISRQYGGTGLGLVICKKLVTLMGGQIWLKSNNDPGSEFVFRIKCEKQEQVQRPQSSKILSGNHNAFVYDRDTLSSKAIGSYLADLGLAVVTSTETQTIEDMIVSIPQDCSLLVLNLSGNDLYGGRFRDIISSVDAQYCGIILVISSLANKEWLQLFGPSGSPENVHYLSKPLSRTRLQGKVSALLDPANKVITVSAKTVPVTASLAGLAIILAEDNQHNRDVLTVILKEYGADVLPAKDGVQALTLCRQQSADILVLDIHMPKIDGIEVCRKLRADNLEIPIIALTADLVADRQMLIEEVGINEVLYKPFDEIKLISTIASFSKNILSGRPAQAPVKSLLDRLPASAVVEEINRLVLLIKIAAQRGELKQVKTFAHQLRGIAVAKGVEHEVQLISARIDDCLAVDQPDSADIEMLLDHLNLISLDIKKP